MKTSNRSKLKSPARFAEAPLLGDCSLAQLRESVEREELLTRQHELRLRNKSNVLDGNIRHIVLSIFDENYVLSRPVKMRPFDFYSLTILSMDDKCLHKILTALKSPKFRLSDKIVVYHFHCLEC